MSKERLKGILAGVTASALVLGMGVTAFAANRSITVSDGIRVLINGQSFQPKDGNGAPVELFSYNGTVYAPVRAICEEAGMQVSYDQSTRTVSITKPTSSQPSSDKDGALIGEEAAKQAAFTHAGVNASDATVTEFKLVKLFGTAHYDIEFYVGSTEYEYEIDAATGSIREAKQEAKKGLNLGSDRISEARAKEIALEKAPDASVTKCKLDRDDGVWVYEIELRSGTTEYECEINASDGTLLKWEIDD